VDAFDADVLIYAALPGHDLGERVRPLLGAGIGSMLLVPELLVKPRREGHDLEVEQLESILARLDLHALDSTVARLAVRLGVAYGLRAPDAVHLATAVCANADRFITNNSRDFPRTITEIDITYPTDLPGPAG
jgi:predicted nucleic acid-binding protein